MKEFLQDAFERERERHNTRALVGIRVAALNTISHTIPRVFGRKHLATLDI